MSSTEQMAGSNLSGADLPTRSPDGPDSGRLLIVSNRLPITVKQEGQSVQVSRTTGGLATGLSGPHEQSGGLWIGWPGDVSHFGAEQRVEIEKMLLDRRIVPVYLSAREVDRFYAEFSNGVLWPLFHYLLDRVPLDAHGWESYRSVNERFAEQTAAQYRPGDRIWVHDYQLMLVPEMLRRHLPEARIGFFLHIPFPSSEVLRILPWSAQVLKGLLGADLVGFHAFSYMRHFMNSLVDVLGMEPEPEQVQVDGRITRTGVFPMGIDSAAFAGLGEDPAVLREVARIRRQAGHRRIVLGVDRLDYTKGIRRRLLAFERLLERRPGLRNQVRLVQVCVPSREKVPEYQRHRSQVEALVGRINGAFADVDSVPIHYMYRSVSQRRLAALYRAADVMLVTPLRDGMNLVAKEFVATRTDNNGVLVLSQFAGAASELGEAIRVNPYDVDGMAEALERSLDMPEMERRARMSILRRRVAAHDVHAWVESFLTTLAEAPVETPRRPLGPSPAAEMEELRARMIEAPDLVLLLDYDGTLTPLVDAPDLATPDGELLELLEALSRRPATGVHVVSGRTRDTLECWLGHLGVGLWAEHGYWSRPVPDGPWQPLFEGDAAWKKEVRPILEQFTTRTPGALIEEKSASLAWHYRMAAPGFGVRQARRLLESLAGPLARLPVEVLTGNKVVEVRMVGVSKARVVAALASAGSPGHMAAFGDDVTDEDLFRALPPGSTAVHVGSGPSSASCRLADVAAVREFLWGLVGGRPQRRGAGPG